MSTINNILKDTSTPKYATDSIYLCRFSYNWYTLWSAI